MPQPSWQIVKAPDEALQQTGARSWVVKAPDRQGQKGLALVRSEDELPAAIARAIEESRSGAAIVEELVDGPEVTVNAFSVRGEFHPLTVTDRLTAEPPAFGVALAHVWPSEAGGKAAEVARAAVEALGIQDGPTYTQLRIGPEGPQVIEVAARLGGGHDAELVHAALGVDLNGLALQAALGEPIWSAALHAVPQVGGAVVRFLVPPEGVLAGGRRASRRHAPSRASRRSASTASRATSSARSCAAPTAPERCSQSARAARRRCERADEAARLIRFEVGAETLV